MIVTTDIASILARDTRTLGVGEVYTQGSIPQGLVSAEYIYIGVLPLNADTYWNVAEANVDMCVPDILFGEDSSATKVANTARLQELERLARRTLGTAYDLYDGTPYRYAIASSVMQADAERECHFINIKIKFKVLHVKN